MAKADFAEQAQAIQSLFEPSSTALKALGENAKRFWAAQDQMLDAMQEFTEGWLRRRHEGTRAAARAARNMCEAESTVDILREQQEWMGGVLQRLMADGVACQKEWMLISGLAVQPFDGAEQATETPPPRLRPEPAERPKAA